MISSYFNHTNKAENNQLNKTWYKIVSFHFYFYFFSADQNYLVKAKFIKKINLKDNPFILNQ
jgi:hypothetical protein